MSLKQLFSLLIFFIILGVGAYFLAQNSYFAKPVSSFDECIKAEDSVTNFSYPPTCTTKNGQSFVGKGDEAPSQIPEQTYPAEGEEIPGSSTGSQDYQCPGKTWVDCMPGVDVGERPECSVDYLQWATRNCAGFEGAAL